MKRILSLIAACLVSVTVFTGCSGGTTDTQTAAENKKGSDTITMVWYPNESGGDLEDSRNEVGKLIETATGKKVEHKLTTDYSIAIEAISNGTGGIAFMGAQGYVEAHAKNDKVQPLCIASGTSGTADDAVYYSWLSVPKDKAEEYQKDGKYSLDNIKGKRMSFVSNSSTSGFKVPTTGIVSYFSKDDKFKDLTAEDLMEGGKDKFFSEVLYGGSHQGSAVNIITDKADVAAFCDSNLRSYIDVAEGNINEVGTVYKVKDNADEPFNTLGGKEFVAISCTPVLNAPFAFNADVISETDKEKIVEVFTSDETANNKKIFGEKGSEVKAFFEKKGNEKFITVEDSWFDPIRKLSE